VAPDSPPKCPERPAKKLKTSHVQPIQPPADSKPQRGQRIQTVRLEASVNPFSTNQDAVLEISVVTDKVPTRYTSDFAEQGVLGKGSFSVVTKCRHRTDGWTYAIKRIAQGPRTTREDAMHEGFVCSALNHPYIVRYHTCWWDQTQSEPYFFLQFEYCAGGSLQAIHHSTKNPINFDQPLLARIMQHIGQALQYLHENKFYHADVKPGNILASTESIGLQTIFKLSDFGNSNRTTAGDSEYLAPEILAIEDSSQGTNTEIWISADVFALGMTVFELGYESSNKSKLDIMDRSNIQPYEIKLGGSFTPAFVLLLQKMMEPASTRLTASQVVDDIALKSNFISVVTDTTPKSKKKSSKKPKP